MWVEFTYNAYGMPQIHMPGAPDNSLGQAVQTSIGLMLTPERKNTLVIIFFTISVNLFYKLSFIYALCEKFVNLH